MIQSGGFLNGMIVNREKEIFKTVDGQGSLLASLVKKSASMGNKGTPVNFTPVN